MSEVSSEGGYFIKLKFPERPDAEIALPVNKGLPCSLEVALSKFKNGIKAAKENGRPVTASLWFKDYDGTTKKCSEEKINID